MAASDAAQWLQQLQQQAKIYQQWMQPIDSSRLQQIFRQLVPTQADVDRSGGKPAQFFAEGMIALLALHASGQAGHLLPNISTAAADHVGSRLAGHFKARPRDTVRLQRLLHASRTATAPCCYPPLERTTNVQVVFGQLARSTMPPPGEDQGIDETGGVRCCPRRRHQRQRSPPPTAQMQWHRSRRRRGHSRRPRRQRRKRCRWRPAGRERW